MSKELDIVELESTTGARLLPTEQSSVNDSGAICTSQRLVDLEKYSKSTKDNQYVEGGCYIDDNKHHQSSSNNDFVFNNYHAAGDICTAASTAPETPTGLEHYNEARPHGGVGLDCDTVSEVAIALVPAIYKNVNLVQQTTSNNNEDNVDFLPQLDYNSTISSSGYDPSFFDSQYEIKDTSFTTTGQSKNNNINNNNKTGLLSIANYGNSKDIMSTPTSSNNNNNSNSTRKFYSLKDKLAAEQQHENNVKLHQNNNTKTYNNLTKTTTTNYVSPNNVSVPIQQYSVLSPILYKPGTTCLLIHTTHDNLSTINPNNNGVGFTSGICYPSSTNILTNNNNNNLLDQREFDSNNTTQSIDHGLTIELPRTDIQQDTVTVENCSNLSPKFFTGLPTALCCTYNREVCSTHEPDIQQPTLTHNNDSNASMRINNSNIQHINTHTHMHFIEAPPYHKSLYSLRNTTICGDDDHRSNNTHIVKGGSSMSVINNIHNNDQIRTTNDNITNQSLSTNENLHNNVSFFAIPFTTTTSFNTQIHHAHINESAVVQQQQTENIPNVYKDTTTTSIQSQNYLLTKCPQIEDNNMINNSANSSPTGTVFHLSGALHPEGSDGEEMSFADENSGPLFVNNIPMQYERFNNDNKTLIMKNNQNFDDENQNSINNISNSSHRYGCSSTSYEGYLKAGSSSVSKGELLCKPRSGGRKRRGLHGNNRKRISASKKKHNIYSKDFSAIHDNSQTTRSSITSNPNINNNNFIDRSPGAPRTRRFTAANNINNENNNNLEINNNNDINDETQKIKNNNSLTKQNNNTNYSDTTASLADESSGYAAFLSTGQQPRFPGVCFSHSKDVWRARITLNRRQYESQFSVKKFGYEEALRQALSWRSSKEILFSHSNQSKECGSTSSSPSRVHNEHTASLSGCSGDETNVRTPKIPTRHGGRRISQNIINNNIDEDYLDDKQRLSVPLASKKVFDDDEAINIGKEKEKQDEIIEKKNNIYNFYHSIQKYSSGGNNTEEDTDCLTSSVLSPSSSSFHVTGEENVSLVDRSINVGSVIRDPVNSQRGGDSGFKLNNENTEINLWYQNKQKHPENNHSNSLHALPHTSWSENNHDENSGQGDTAKKHKPPSPLYNEAALITQSRRPPTPPAVC